MRRATFCCLLLAACSVDEHPAQVCETVADCPAGQRCYEGFCIGEATADAGPGADAGMSGDAGPECVAQTETCNDVDDDCDGSVDEVAGVGNGCRVADAAGICAVGRFECGDGELVCVGPMPGDLEEACDNGTDDDCDGSTDEDCACESGETQPCYSGPPDTSENAPCMAGTQSCDGGTWGACMGAVEPDTESCSGVDDDCNGFVDDVAGLGGECDTDDDGACRVGALTCTESGLECVSPDPTEETCNLVDDDCDGVVDNGFDLMNDPMNCGTCGNTCEGGSCCNGTCVDTASNEAHCGECNTPCEGADAECCSGLCQTESICAGCTEECGGDTPDCCAMECVSTVDDPRNCGECGRTCGSDEVCVAGVCQAETDECCGSGVACTDCAADGNGLCCNHECVPRNADHCVDCLTGCGNTCCPAQTMCADLDSDENHCGACGRSCGDGQTCCDGECVNTDTDRRNCGVCGRDCTLLIIPLGCSGGTCG